MALVYHRFCHAFEIPHVYISDGGEKVCRILFSCYFLVLWYFHMSI